MRTSEHIGELVTALIKAHGSFETVVRAAKGQVGQNREYRYADLATLINATWPALLENGLVVAQAVDAETSSLHTRLAHTSGQWMESAYPLGRYEKPQDFGSQLSYARRYSLLGLLGVAQEDDDGADAQKVVNAPAARPAVAKKPTTKPLPPAASSAPAEGFPLPSSGPAVINEAQRKRLWTIAGVHHWDKAVLKGWLEAMGFQSTSDIPLSAYDDVISGLEAGPPQVN
jgi:hypothetical protein